MCLLVVVAMYTTEQAMRQLPPSAIEAMGSKESYLRQILEAELSQKLTLIPDKMMRYSSVLV